MQHSFVCCVQVGDVQATCHELEKKLQAAEVKASKVCEQLHHADLYRLGMNRLVSGLPSDQSRCSKVYCGGGHSLM